MRKTIIYLIKCAVSAALATVILSGFSLIYYNPPIVDVQPDKTTNNRFIPNKKWSYMLEGYGYGRTDNYGYNNAYYPNCENPDILVVGSSHMEALQVPDDSNCVYLLNEMLENDDLKDNDFKCYNLGVSAHFFDVSLNNLEAIVSKYSNAKYVVIETFDVELSAETMDKILKGELYSPYVKKGVIAETVRNIPYFRLLYKRIQEISTQENNAVSVADIPDMKLYEEKMCAVLDKVVTLSEEYGFEPIILMHDRIYEDEDGNIVPEKDELHKSVFRQCCEKKGITVVDVTAEFISHYKNTDEFPYGFSNTVPGTGHLNKTGHRLIAEKLYEIINGMVVK